MSSDVAKYAPSLPFLPRELLSIIASELDRTSLLALVRVSSQFLHLRDEHIWEELDLSLPVYHGRYPLIQPYAEEDVVPYGEWYEDECERAERRYRADLCEMLGTIQARADGGHWTKVRHITLDLRPGAVGAVIDILRAVSPYLETLSIDGGGWHSARGTLLPASGETLDVQLITSGLHFPNLHTIALARNSISYDEVVNLLSNMSPSLTKLFAVLDLCEVRRVDVDTPLIGFPPLTRLANLRTLEITYGGNGDDNGMEEEGTDDSYDVAATETALELLLQSSGLEKLHLDYTGSTSGLKRELLWGVQDHPAVAEFSCGLDPSEFRAIISAEGMTLPTVRVLTLEPLHCLTIFANVPSLPHVEVVYLQETFAAPANPSSSVTVPSGAQSMIHPFATHLRDSPHLRTLHIVWEDDAEDEEGFVHSYRHGSDEILHARLLLDLVEVSDGPTPERVEGDSVPDLTIEYTAFDGSLRDRTYVRLSEPVWQHYTDGPGGRIVPLEILEEMRRVEGLSEEEWANRGVEVGDEAWRVVMDYLDREGA